MDKRVYPERAVVKDNSELFRSLTLEQIEGLLGTIDFAALPESNRKFVSGPENTGNLYTSILQFVLKDPRESGLEPDFFPQDFPQSQLGLFSGSGRVESYIQKNLPTIKNTTLVDVEFAENKSELKAKGTELIEGDVFKFLLNSKPTDKKYDLVVSTAAGFLFDEKKPYNISLKIDHKNIYASQLFKYIMTTYLPNLLNDKAMVMISAEEGPPLFDGVPGFTSLLGENFGLYLYAYDRSAAQVSLAPETRRN